MNVHPAVSEIINNNVLRDVVRIHGMQIPYPAELWVKGQREHEQGTAMFSIGDSGYLRAEYFGYDNNPRERWWRRRTMRPEPFEAELVMKDTGIILPIWLLKPSPKTLTWNSVAMSEVVGYDCEFLGRLGNSCSEMQSVTMTISGMPNVHLGQVTTPVPDESTTVENIFLHGFKELKGGLKFEAREWRIGLWESYQVNQEGGRPLYFVNVSRMGGVPFVLGDDINTGIIGALRKFLSFQCARQIDIPTVICLPVIRENELFTIKSAWLGRLYSHEEPRGNPMTATEVHQWPSLFEEFWNRYDEPESRDYLENALYHYFEAERVYETGSIGQALVAVQSTLQALTRWWDDRDIEFDFESRGPNTYRKLVIEAVKKAELGKDSGVEINQGALKEIIKKAADYRNDIDHGKGLKIVRNAREVDLLRMHHHGLARDLILAKLGYRPQDARGMPFALEFSKHPN